MSLDRRIVSILYYNNIFDVNSVEEFIGEKNNFYEIKIDGKIIKLEIPNKDYNPEKIVIEFNDLPSKQYLDDKLIELTKNYDAIKENQILKVTESFDEDLEKTEIEKKIILEKGKKANPKISSKKIQIVDSKKIDDDLDDFINIM